VTTTDPTLRRLLRAVLADPADDTARLVLADWLEEAGDGERAEFIRVQVELAQLGHVRGREDDATWQAVCRLCGQARDHYWFPREFAGAPRFKGRAIDGGGLSLEYEADGGVNPELVVRRGFVSEARCTLSDFERHAAALFAAQPIERVVLTDKQPSSFDKGVPPFYWFGDGWISSRHDDELPDYLLGIMEELRLGNSFNRPDGAKARTFDASQLALDAASAALVTYGRRLARIDVPCDDCDGSGRTTLGKPLKAGGFDHKCLACGGSGCVLNADH
jgi:uncharacterized protein (TIGR02996 family)